MRPERIYGGTRFKRSELTKVMVAFEYDESLTPGQIREGLAKAKYVGFQEIKCHLIFVVLSVDNSRN
jgi:hypothetical protein